MLGLPVFGPVGPEHHGRFQLPLCSWSPALTGACVSLNIIHMGNAILATAVVEDLVMIRDSYYFERPLPLGSKFMYIMYGRYSHQNSISRLKHSRGCPLSRVVRRTLQQVMTCNSSRYDGGGCISHSRFRGKCRSVSNLASVRMIIWCGDKWKASRGAEFIFSCIEVIMSGHFSSLRWSVVAQMKLFMVLCDLSTWPYPRG